MPNIAKFVIFCLLQYSQRDITFDCGKRKSCYGRLKLGNPVFRARASLTPSRSGQCEGLASGRRVNAGLLRSLIGRMLKTRLPPGWTHQMISGAGARDVGGESGKPDVVVISPAGRCHFLFAKAPADRWWDGDLRCVAAEPLTESERALMARLRKGGNRARAVWSTKEAARVLAQWGCGPMKECMVPDGGAPMKRNESRRAKLKLKPGGV